MLTQAFKERLRFRCQAYRGFTLVELLLSMIIVFMVLAMIHTSMQLLLRREHGATESARVQRGTDKLVGVIGYIVRGADTFFRDDQGVLSDGFSLQEGTVLHCPKSFVLPNDDPNDPPVPRPSGDVPGTALVFAAAVDRLATQDASVRPDLESNLLDAGSGPDGFPDGLYEVVVLYGDSVGFAGDPNARELVIRRYRDVMPATRFSASSIDFTDLFLSDDFDETRTELFYGEGDLRFVYAYRNRNDFEASPAGIRITGDLLAVRTTERKQEKLRLDVQMMSRNF